LLAIMKTGAAYTPLDPSYPPSRLEYMLNDSQAPLLVTDTAHATRVGNYSGAKVLLDAEKETLLRSSSKAPVTSTRPESLAYVIYTSGSAGLPKGVEVPHRGLVNVVSYFAQELRVVPADTLLAVTSISFDISGLEIFLPLTRGATLRILPR